MIKEKVVIYKHYTPWVVCFVSALFFLYEFIQINMFNSIDLYVMRSYSLGSTELGLLSSIYFYSTVAFMLPAGQILDKFSPKKVIILTLIICITGLVGFAITTNIYVAATCRFLEGIGSAFCFLGSFRIAANWFPRKNLTLVTGLIMTIGMLGGVIAQTPLTILVSRFGWRIALLIDAVFGIIILLAICLFVLDKPIDNDNSFLDRKKIKYLTTMKKAYVNKNNWACGFYTCLMNSPMVLLGALWGSLYLEQVHHFTKQSASVAVSMIFIGTIIGSTIFGSLCNLVKNRRVLMLFGALLSIVIILEIIFANTISYFGAIVLFLLMGIFSSSQVLGYPTAAQNGAKEMTAMSASVVSFITMTGYIILQPLFGLIMDLVSNHNFINSIPTYTPSSYHYALLLIPVAVGLAAFSLVFVKEPIK